MHIVAGAGAGACAAALSNPLDVAKTLLNTQESSVVHEMSGRQHVSGMMLAMRTIYRQSGPKGYTKGLQARILYQMPATATTWSIYELLKYVFNIYPEDAVGQG